MKKVLNKSGFVYEDFNMPLVDNDLRYTENYMSQQAKDTSFQKKTYKNFTPDKNIIEKDFDLIRMTKKEIEFKGNRNTEKINPLWNVDVILNVTSKALALAGLNKNDGAVPQDSSRFGKYQGAVKGVWALGGLTHFQLTDRSQALVVGLTPGFDARVWYRDRVSEMKSWGW